MKKALLVLVVVGVLASPVLAGEVVHSELLGQVLVAAAEAGDAGAPEFPRAKQAITEFLALGEGQVAEWDALLAAREAAVAPLREQLRSTEEQLRELLEGDNPDPNAVGTLVISGKTLREGMQAAHKTYVDGFEAMLTPDQKGKLGAVRRAARLAPLLPAFGIFGLIPPAPGQVR
jgi:Spy/CpxP family protein refolding chaperone